MRKPLIVAFLCLVPAGRPEMKVETAIPDVDTMPLGDSEDVKV